MRVIVTRPAAQAAAWVEQLKALGVDAVALPLIAIQPADLAPVDPAWTALPKAALAVFVSANAVAHFFARSAGRAWPAQVLAGATGPGTSAALREAGVPPANIAEPAADGSSFDSEALWQQLAGRDWTGKPVLIVRGDGGRDWLAETLRAAGAQVDFVAAYSRSVPSLDAAQRALLAAAQAAPRDHLWLFSSSEAVAALATLAPQADWQAAAALATHPRIARAARAAGFGRVAEVRPGAEAVAASIHSLS